jgi:MoaA/NifB/PqqE/SkfB family radical SAM enzyme
MSYIYPNALISSTRFISMPDLNQFLIVHLEKMKGLLEKAKLKKILVGGSFSIGSHAWVEKNGELFFVSDIDLYVDNELSQKEIKAIQLFNLDQATLTFTSKIRVKYLVDFKNYDDLALEYKFQQLKWVNISEMNFSRRKYSSKLSNIVSETSLFHFLTKCLETDFFGNDQVSLLYEITKAVWRSNPCNDFEMGNENGWIYSYDKLFFFVKNDILNWKDSEIKVIFLNIFDVLNGRPIEELKIDLVLFLRNNIDFLAAKWVNTYIFKKIMQNSLNLKFVEDYFKKVVFVFLPNICNAACDFCYIEPALTNRNIILGKERLEKLDFFVRRFSQLGFEDFRITGGEPMIFEDINDLFDIFEKYKVKCSILTNGSKLNLINSTERMDLISNITISFHSYEKYSEIFGPNLNKDVIIGNIKNLLKLKYKVTVTILLLPINSLEIIQLIQFFVNLGVENFKFLYPNDSIIKDSLLVKYKDIIQNIKLRFPKILIRFNNSNQLKCHLNDRGLISYNLTSNSLYSCCVVVPYGERSETENGILNLFKTLQEFYINGLKTTKYPCISHVNYCPISLTQ